MGDRQETFGNVEVGVTMNSNGHTKDIFTEAEQVLDDIHNETIFEALASIIDGDDRRHEVELLAGRIGAADKLQHGRIRDAILKADPSFSRTEAEQFIKNCVAKVKRQRKEQDKADEQARKNKQKADTIAARDENTIIVGDRQLRDIRADAMAALVNLVESDPTQPPLYVKVGALSRIVKDENGIYSCQEIKPSAMPGILSDAATWVVPVESEKGYKEVNVFPPKDVAADVLNLGKWPGIPALAAIANAPVFGRGGVLHSDPGYNPATGLYYTGGVTLGDTTPTPERVAWAKHMLLTELMGDFPFPNEASKAHALAYGIDPFIREMVDGPIPPTAFDAPTEGTGKSLLQNNLAYLFLGHDAPTMADTEDDEEWRKRITSKLLSGATHATIDNVRRELDSGVLANAWTQPIWDDRTLGVNRDVKIPNRMIWAITANNMHLSRENTRRVVWCRLDANMERPHLRDVSKYRHPDLKEWIKANRDELVTAIIVLIRAWIDAGRPRYRGRAKGSFESWTYIMGGIFQVCGIPGFLDNEDELFAHAVSDADEMGDFIEAWANKYGAQESGINRHLFKLASYSDDDNEQRTGDYKNLLSGKLTSTKQRGRQIQLGRLLDDAKGRVYRGYKVAYVRLLSGEKIYKLEDHREVPSNVDELLAKGDVVSQMSDAQKAAPLVDDEIEVTL